MRSLVLLTGVILVSCILSDVSCITNREFFELVKDYAEDLQEFDIDDPAIDDLDDAEDSDVIELPGDPDDELDIGYLITKLDLADALQNVQEAPLKQSDKSLGWWRRGRRRRRRRRRWHNPCHCRHDECSCCLRHTFKINLIFHKYRFRVNVCVKVAYLRRDHGFSFTITYNGRRLFHHEISLRKPPSLCYGVPGLKHFVRACIEVYNVNLHSKSLCLRVAFIIDIKLKKFRWHLKLGCFRIPILAELEGLDTEQLLNQIEMTMADKQTGVVEEVSMVDLPTMYRQLQVELAEMYNDGEDEMYTDVHTEEMYTDVHTEEMYTDVHTEDMYSDKHQDEMYIDEQYEQLKTN